MVAPVYRGQRGHPVGFAEVYGARLVTLDRRRGARAILASAKPLLIETDDAGVVTDIDSPDDWKTAMKA